MTTTNHPEVSFFRFIWNERRNRNYLLVALAGMVVQFVIFKILYPFPDFFSDSYSFIWAAKEHMNVNLWPIGYSKYLLLIHYITHSDTFLIATQYLLVILSGLYFYFTILYWYYPSRSTRIILFLFLFFNPLFLYLSNYVASEALFLGLSVIWFTQLLWIINRPKNWLIFTHAIVLLLAFTVRYNAMYYPIISTVAFIMSRQRVMMKLAGITLSVLLVGGFVMWTRDKMNDYAGVRVFSPLSGWHLANSALYMYPTIQTETNDFTLPTSRNLDQMVFKYFDTGNIRIRNLTPAEGAYFLKDPHGPLKSYMRQYTKSLNYDADGFKEWAQVAPQFSDYATSLILSHPIPYFKSYILPNTMNYFVPPLEKLNRYNSGLNIISTNAKNWFDYKSNIISSFSKSLQEAILYFYPSFNLFINSLFLFSCLFLLRLRKSLRHQISLNKLVLIISAFWLMNFIFSIISAPIMLRYQAFPMILFLAAVLIVIEALEIIIKSFPKNKMKGNWLITSMSKPSN